MPQPKFEDIEVVTNEPENENKGINTILIIASVVLLVTFGGLAYLYFSVRNASQEKPSFSKPIKIIRPTIKVSPTKALPSPQPAKASEKTELIVYENENLGFTFKYYPSWGTLEKEEADKKTIFTLKPEDKFSLTVEPLDNPGTASRDQLELAAESLKTAGCGSQEDNRLNYPGLMIYCEEGQSATEYLLVQTETNLYSLRAQYDQAVVANAKTREENFSTTLDNFFLL
ncbi:MAG: hypothetical protein JW991_00025 [Candidatus Pacebacteria bacterium]|nr:hypothetical protein [Candidatus Paceibacterota bacterium]